MRQPTINDLKLALADAELEKRMLREEIAQLIEANGKLSQELANATQANNEPTPG